MHAATQLALREQREPPFHEVQPRGARRGEVQMEPRPPQEPPTDQGGLMRAIVVQNQMHVQVGWDIGRDRIEKVTELCGPMPLVE